MLTPTTAPSPTKTISEEFQHDKGFQQGKEGFQVADGDHRYVFGCDLKSDPDTPKSVFCFIMLNPSKATHDEKDTTVKKIKEYAKSKGCTDLIIVNLFAIISPKTQVLKQKINQDPKNAIGPKNNECIKRAIQMADKIIIAWGNKGRWQNQAKKEALEFVTDLDPIKSIAYCFGKTVARQPYHPMYFVYRGKIIPELVLWKDISGDSGGSVNQFNRGKNND